MREKEAKRVMLVGQPMYLLMSHDYCLSSIASSLLIGVEELLKEFGDIFPKGTPHGLPPLRGIEHQIDLIPRASLPNKLAYRSNPQETKEIQRQLESLMEKRWVRESLSPCAMLVILVPKKDGTLRMCTNCRAINNLSIFYLGIFHQTGWRLDKVFITTHPIKTFFP